MLVEFTKMNGAGNDFVLMDNRAGKIALTPDDVVRLCDRHRGVGADGVFLLKPCASGKADWAWDFYNSDGSSAGMCGNGARCFARFVKRMAGGGDGLTWETLAGVVQAKFEGEDQVTIRMVPPSELKLNQSVALKSGPAKVHSVNTGVPHAVLFVEDAAQAPVLAQGAELRYHAHFAPRGTNVNFAQVLGENKLRLRTYERGVEAETQACGTGATASALVASALHGWSGPVSVQVEEGSTLRIGFERQGTHFTGATLSGPAEFVFDGKIDLTPGRARPAR